MTRLPYASLHAALLLLALILSKPSSAADKPNSAELNLTTEKVIVFKDGYCLVLKRGVATTDENGEIFTTEVPDAAALGSFWAVPKKGRMISMVAGWSEKTDEEAEDVRCAQTLEVLVANRGKSCTLQLKDVKLSGVIETVLSRETSAPIAESHRSTLDAELFRALSRSSVSSVPPDATAAPRVSGVSGHYFVLRNDNGDTLINVSEIRQLTIPNMKTTIERRITRTTKSKRLRFRFEKPSQKQEILISYFRPGVRWIPSYRIDLAGNEGKKTKMAEISMQAEIINEAEDLIDTPIDIVVGVPNFRFRNVTSPFTLEKVLRNALQQAAPQLMGQFRNSMSNAMFSQRAGEFSRPGPHPGAGVEVAGVDLPPELSAGGGHDLFVYNLPALRLRKGERAAVPIFTSTAPYRDVHTWDLHYTRADVATSPSGSGIQSPLTLSENKIWRQIELTNNTNVPWTTGAAMIMDGQQPLAQELLTYTSPKDYCRVPVTVAIDVRGSHEEAEFDRQLKALRWSGYDYAKIQERTKLSVKNHKSEPIALEITLRFGGRATEATHDGDIILSPYKSQDWRNYRGAPAVNNSSTVIWKTQVKAGERFEPSVESMFYTRQ